MNPILPTTDNRPAQADRQPVAGVRHWAVAIALVLMVCATGCSNLRLPAVDPNGARLFQPLPITTELALPCQDNELLSRLRSRLSETCSNLHSFQFPTPAFPEPIDPPSCLTPGQGGICGSGAQPQACVPSAPCNGSCATGPPAVLLGNECDMKDLLRLPDRGKRGCILLSPQKIIAPVGGEVTLLSGICGTDGYLQMGEPLEWMLTPDSVGTFIQVGDDDPGLLHKLAGVKRAEKQDPSFARGVTSTKRTLITRGNLNAGDDIQLEKGQTWLTLSSPSEGTSRVTVLAPESECWDQRKATATIYWVDARWEFPRPQRVSAGTNVTLRTRVTRAEGTFPARGWKVRYELMQPELAGFAGTAGDSVVEVEVDESGFAPATLVPMEGAQGSAVIDVKVIRPGGESDNLPTMTLGQGQAYVTWSAPGLRLRLGAPEVASYNTPFPVVVNVGNPGDETATAVRVQVQIPPGVQLRGSDLAYREEGDRLIWELGDIPAQMEREFNLSMVSQNPVRLTFQAESAEGLFQSAVVETDVYRPSLALSVQARRESTTVGEPAAFVIIVENTGDRVLDRPLLEVVGSESMLDAIEGKVDVSKEKESGVLNPGEVWERSVGFTPTTPGQKCIQVTASTSGGQRATAQACVIAYNPDPPNIDFSTRLDSLDLVTVNEFRLVRGFVVNEGEVPLRNVRVRMVYDP
ncbi:MAG: hypothetical protein AAGA03_05010, partial [Planctomycetota bacterium]